MREWKQHYGGERPESVAPDAWIELPAGTYHSDNGRGTMGPFRADSLIWNKDKVFHLRDEIRFYRVMTEEEEAIAAFVAIGKKRGIL